MSSKTTITLTRKYSSTFPANNSHYLCFTRLKKMSQNTRTQNSGPEADPRRNNPPPYNLRPLLHQMEEQEDDEPLLVARRRVARCKPRCDARTEHLEQRIDMLTELVNTLVTTFCQNAAHVAPAIPPGMLLANAEGEEVPPPQEGRDATVSEARTDAHACRRTARRRHQNAPKRGVKIERPLQNPVRLSTLGIQFLIGLSE